MISPGVVNWYSGARADTSLTLAAGTTFNMFGGTFTGAVIASGQFRTYSGSTFSGAMSASSTSQVYCNAGSIWRGAVVVSPNAVFIMYV